MVKLRTFQGITFDICRICFISYVSEIEDLTTGKMGDTQFSFLVDFGGSSLSLKFKCKESCEVYRKELIEDWGNIK